MELLGMLRDMNMSRHSAACQGGCAASTLKGPGHALRLRSILCLCFDLKLTKLTFIASHTALQCWATVGWPKKLGQHAALSNQRGTSRTPFHASRIAAPLLPVAAATATAFAAACRCRLRRQQRCDAFYISSSNSLSLALLSCLQATSCLLSVPPAGMHPSLLAGRPASGAASACRAAGRAGLGRLIGGGPNLRLKKP